MKDYVLILGATSGIARALGRALAGRWQNLVLAGRDLEELERLGADLNLRHGIEVVVEPFDARAFDEHRSFLERCAERRGRGLVGVVLCYGVMADQEKARRDFSLAHEMIEVNYSSAVSILNCAADFFKQRDSGFICAVTSVAGDRGRASNYLYGSTKAALSVYLEGLGAALADTNVKVIDVKPGPVKTTMTWGLPVAGPLAEPERIAADICAAIDRSKPLIYSPWIWRWIMMVIRWIPRRIFVKMKM